MKYWLPFLVARVPATVHSKLLAAFLAIVVLLIVVGVVGLELMSGVNRRAGDLVQLQRKIAAYRQLQHGTTAQLYSVASALLVHDEPTLEAALRQLNQFSYSFDRFQFVAKDEIELLGQVRDDYDQFTQVVSRVVELIRSGKIEEGNQLQIAQANPLAERLERAMNQLVNRAGADMVDSVHASDAAYAHSRWIVIGFAIGSIVLALVLGYALSWSLIGPVKAMDLGLKQIASGDFSSHVEVLNRDELGTLAANLNRMNDELGQLYQQLATANRHKSEFLAQVNHDLRTPVSSIVGYARLLRRDLEGQMGPLQRENLDDLQRNGERLLGMIDSLLDFAKIEAGKIEVKHEPVCVDLMIREVAATCQAMLNNGKLQIIVAVAPDIPMLITDREKLRQIVLNLVDNAVKFTERGEIKITAAQHQGTLRLAVSDSGIGIAEEDVNYLFEEFYRGRSATRGTGLGLAIVKKFVNILGGDIAVESQVGEGSTFTLTLPLEPNRSADPSAQRLAS